MKPFDIVSAKIYFEDSKQFKYRPVLCIAIKGNDVVVRKMTGSPKRDNYPGEYPLKDWKQEGLNKATVVRMSKHVTIPTSYVKGIIGHLSKRDELEIRALINTPYKESYNIDDEIDEYLTQLI